jgi:hypothetical protein
MSGRSCAGEMTGRASNPRPRQEIMRVPAPQKITWIFVILALPWGSRLGCPFPPSLALLGAWPWALGPGPLALPSLALGPWTLGAQGTASLAGAVVDFVMVGPGLSILQDFVHVGALLCRRDDWSGQQPETPPKNYEGASPPKNNMDFCNPGSSLGKPLGLPLSSEPCALGSMALGPWAWALSPAIPGLPQGASLGASQGAQESLSAFARGRIAPRSCKLQWKMSLAIFAKLPEAVNYYGKSSIRPRRRGRIPPRGCKLQWKMSLAIFAHQFQYLTDPWPLQGLGPLWAGVLGLDPL